MAAWGWELDHQLDAYFEALDKDVTGPALTEESLDVLVQDAKDGVFGPEVAAVAMVPDDVDEELSTSGRNWLDVNNICSFCYGDHDMEDCNELEAIEAEDEAYMTAQKANAIMDKGIPNFWGDDVPDETPLPNVEFEEDENRQLIPLDPNEPCYNRDTGEKFECKCKTEKINECIVCGVGREWRSHQWRPWRKDGEYNVAKRNKQKKAQKQKPYEASKAVKDEKKAQGAKTTVVTSQKPPAGPVKPLGATGGYAPTKPTTTSTAPKTGTSSFGFSGGTSTYVGKDRHYDDEYTTWDGSTVFHISSMWNNRKEDEFVPDWGLYFDWGWRPWWRAEHIDWRDYSIPENFAIAFEQLLVAIEKAQAGVKVEMGCIGAHGRTGTALAVINVMLGCEAKEAIAHVREHHCEHAIESDVQEWWVEWVYAQIHGTECRERPTYKPKYASTTTTTTKPVGSTTAAVSKACSKMEHFNGWLWVPAGKDAHCPTKGAACGYWEEDYDEFCKGKYPKLNEPTWNQILLSESVTVNGFIVPKPKGPTTSKLGTTDQGQGPREPRNTTHMPAAHRGCRCDTCRYLARGHGAFLCPASVEGKKKWTEEMNALEETATYNAADRKGDIVAKMIAEKEGTESEVTCGTLKGMKALIAPTKGLTPVEKAQANGYPKQLHPTGTPTVKKIEALDGDAKFIKLATPDGQIMSVPVHEDYTKSHPLPKPTTAPTHGTKSGEYVWINGEGWVSEFLAKANL